MLIVQLLVSHAHVNLCHFFSSPWIRGWLRLLLIALPGHFCLPFRTLSAAHSTNMKARHCCHQAESFSLNVMIDFQNGLHMKDIYCHLMIQSKEFSEMYARIGGRLITNSRFVDDIVVNAEEEEEAGVLVDRLDTTTTRYKMEIGPDKR